LNLFKFYFSFFLSIIYDCFLSDILLLSLSFTFDIISDVTLSKLVCNSAIFDVPFGKLLIFSFAILLNESNFSISLSKSACSLGVIILSFLISFILLITFVCASLVSAFAFFSSVTCFVCLRYLLCNLKHNSILIIFFLLR